MITSEWPRGGWPPRLLAVLERQLGGKVRFAVPDRAILAALLHRLRPGLLRRLRAAGPPGHSAALAP
ncbi:hypothetical protein NE236_26155 [Actinoallomurus purpureus]|uniref:hypothetical protein n=1 Tax=Actinoallomurus purpureus TaxID=478114 RepID=UPI002093FE5D|nr:hypothetical protein [Actinoallomurus purpureus]MCO6008465.1 hypothetical protein [Actinoallomurus purpureus]